MSLSINNNPKMLALDLEPSKNGDESALQVSIPLKDGRKVRFSFTAGMSVKEFKPQDVDLLLGVINKRALSILEKKQIPLDLAEFVSVKA